MTDSKSRQKVEGVTAGTSCDYYLIRYVSDVVKNEFINIGVIIPSRSEDASRTLARFTENWEPVLLMDENADIEMLSELGREITGRLMGSEGTASSKAMLDMMLDSFSASVQISDLQVACVDGVAAGLDELMKKYVA